MLGFDTVRTELGALLSSTAAMPFHRWLAGESIETDSVHPTPDVLVHGLLGSASNFWALRRHLACCGVERFSSFSYGPRIDYQTLAPQFGAFLEDVCRRSGTEQVDVVGHSLGGLVARYLIEQGDGRRIRRLVSLGSPWYGTHFPGRELAIFGAADWLIPRPDTDRTHGQVVVAPGAGHLSLLYDARVFDWVAAHLTAMPRTIRLAVQRERVAA